MKTRSVRGRARPTTAALAAGALAGALLGGCASNDDDDPGTLDGEPPAADAGGFGVPDGGDAESFSEGVVAAANPIAAEAGRQVLADGGNAIDAAVTVQFVLNVVEPTSSGIGGGGFMGVHLAEADRTFFLDSREKGPAAATPTQFLVCDPDCTEAELRGEEAELAGLIGTDDGDEVGFTDVATSGIAVGVPGTLLGAAQALERYGTYSLAKALEPAVALARDGFVVNERLASLIVDDGGRTQNYAETIAVFRPDGEPLEAGDTLVQPDLAATFEAIAAGGVEAFYTGPVAEAIVAAQRESYRDTVGAAGAGRMTLDDLAAYLEDYEDGGIDEREPVSAAYRGYEIAGMPFPSSGGLTVGQILGCLERFDLGDEAAGFGAGSAATLHVMAESMRLAFSSRSVWMGDDDAEGLALPAEGLLADGYLEPRCALISTDARIPDDAIEPGDPRPFDPAFGGTEAASVANAAEGEVGVDTTHFTVIDANGNVVSWTSTIEGTWGTGITVPGHGFLLNNELTDFNFAPQANADPDAYAPGANDVAPGKRPRSSMSPTLVFEDGTFVGAYGSPGGSTIINSVVNVTLNLVDHGLPVQEAIDAPRLSVTSPTGGVSYEEGFSEEALEGLRELGHTLADAPDEIGSVQAVVVDPDTGLQYGGADDRRAGAVRGLPVMR